MKKRLLSVALVVAMVATSLVGCGSGNKSSQKDADKFYIGGIGPVTGSAAMYGMAVKQGAQLAVDEINKAGGINGYQIEYDFQDDENDAEKALNAYNNLKDWGMQMLMGTVTTTPCLAVVAETESDNMFQLTPSASAADVITGANSYQICFQDPVQGTYAADYVDQYKLGTKVGIIYNSQDVYSSGIEANFKKQAKDLGFEIVSESSFTNDNATDFTVQLKQAKDAGADLIFLPIYYTEASIILSQAATMNYDVNFFGCDGLDGITDMDNFDKSLAEGVKLLTPFAASATDELTANFVKNYQAAYNEVPTQFAADAYDCIYAIKAAIEAADAKPDMSASDLCDAITAQMSTIKIAGVTGEEITWDETGAVDKTPKLVTITNGEYVMD